MDACADEAMYQIDENDGGTPGSLPAGKKTPKTLSGSKSNKRKRLRENLAQLASEGELETPMFKRKSSELPRRSLSVSFLDATADTSTPFSGAEDMPTRMKLFLMSILFSLFMSSLIRTVLQCVFFVLDLPLPLVLILTEMMIDEYK